MGTWSDGNRVRWEPSPVGTESGGNRVRWEPSPVGIGSGRNRSLAVRRNLARFENYTDFLRRGTK